LRGKWRLPRHHYELVAAVLLALGATRRDEDLLAPARGETASAPPAPTLRAP